MTTIPRTNETHDPALTSWVESANAPTTDFPIQNLPFGVFRRSGTAEAFRGGVAIGDQIVDLTALVTVGVLQGDALAAARLASQPALNGLMAAGASTWSALRLALSGVLHAGAADVLKLTACLVPQAQAEMALPARIADYTDFYASIHHATTVGAMFRPDAPLMPNYKWIPIGYHGRASSIGVSGQAFARPMGQRKPPDAPVPDFGPSRRMDYELEMGVFVGPGNALGDRVPIDQAPAHIFGMCLLNDWSARDIQGWEYQPLGPFLGKSFATTVSPWIVSYEALAPYRTAWTRVADDPQPLAYLESAENRAAGAIDIVIEAWLETQAMRAAGTGPSRLSQSNFKHSYWSILQMLTHHTANGCNLAPGDLMGTGTQSGPTPAEAGSMLELSLGGKQKITLPNGELRTFLEDGDTIILRAYCERPGARRIGFGECAGTMLAARLA